MAQQMNNYSANKSTLSYFKSLKLLNSSSSVSLLNNSAESGVTLSGAFTSALLSVVNRYAHLECPLVVCIYL